MKQTLLNSLLVAAGLLAGTIGAWGEDTKEAFSQDFTGTSTTPSDYDFTLVGTGNDGGKVENGVLTIVAGGGSKDIGYEYQAKFTSIGSGNIVTFSCDWSTGNATGTRAYSEIYLADASGNKILDVSYDGQNKKLNLNNDVVASNVDRDKTHAVKAVVDMNLKVVTSLSVGSVYSAENIAFASSSASEISVFGFKNTAKNSWTTTSSIDNVSITYEESKAEMANYTINYTFDGAIVATTEATDVVGKIISAGTVVYNADKTTRYLVKADEIPSMTLTAGSSNVLNVEVRKPYTATLNVTTKIGDATTGETATTNLVEADDRTKNWVYTYSIYALKDDVYYIADNTESFGENGTFTDGETINKTVTYSNKASEVVYFKEAESAAGSNIKWSGGADGFVVGQNYRNRGLLVGELPAGTYQFSAVITGSNKRSLVVREYIETQEDAATSKIFGILSSSTQSATFTLEEAKKVIINGANSGDKATNQSENFDYVVIKRVATDEKLSISSAGYATFAPTGNVTIPSDVTVYTVKLNSEESTITLNKLDEDAIIPAGTGVLVAGSENEYTFKGTTSDAATLADNNLKVADGVTKADGKQYGLANVNGKVGFFKITSETVMPKGKAYLEVDEASAAKMSFFSLDGEVTGISTVEAAKADNGAFYTLQGVKTAKPSKGLYIYKGKKVIVK